MEGYTNLVHYGMPRRSGRYPWGSGENPYQRNKNFVGYIRALQDEGLTEKEIAQGLDISIRELRDERSRASNAIRQADIMKVQQLRDRGHSPQAISQRLEIPESTVRSHLRPGVLDRAQRIDNTAKALVSAMNENKYLDIGAGVEHHMQISAEQLRAATKMLTDEGYQIHYLNVPQVTMPGQFTRAKVLAPPGTKTTDIYRDMESIGTINVRSNDRGRTMLGLKEPLNIDSKRIQVVYDAEGGSDGDGVLYVRPGVSDVSLGGNSYAQVRVAVDGTHYLKGMAVYKDDLPAGIDIQFNTNKHPTGTPTDAMKPLQRNEDGSIDMDNPFGASIKRQILDRDAKGVERTTSAMNIVNEEGDWSDWNRSLPSQVLSKQSNTLARNQLNEVVKKRAAELEEIQSLTNPTVRKHLLEKHADAVDSDAIDLQAAAMPRQATSVILPVKSMRDTEVYAPRFNNGEEVVLVRFPHGGTFEMPRLKVNNRNSEAKSMIPLDAPDAIGINARVAAQLSGADFDGDTVLVIPNERTGSNQLKTSPPLEGLKDFDPQRSYPRYDGMKPLNEGYQQKLMGSVSNLITDMTIKGATEEEVARAVRHSMVVIDAVKKDLNWRQSEIDNRIPQLKEKYQSSPGGGRGASTIISRSTGQAHVPERMLRRASEGGPIDPKTGELVYVETGRTDWRGKPRQTRTVQGRTVTDAHDLVSAPSGTPIERIYADHSNRLRAIANEARKELIATKDIPRSPAAARTYADEVTTLRAKLTEAQANAPLERRAQMLANTIVEAKKSARPSVEKDTLKKWNNQAIVEARDRLGAKKTPVYIGDREWEAIQAGAVTKTMLEQLLQNADLTRVRELATPRQTQGITTAMLARAQAMVNGGATLAEAAQALGISASGLSSALRGG